MDDDDDIDFSDIPEFGGYTEEEFADWMRNGPKGVITQWIKDQARIRQQKQEEEFMRRLYKNAVIKEK